MATKRLSRKRKDILLTALAQPWALQALYSVDDLDAGNITEKDFLRQYGFTAKAAEEALEALVENLKK